MTFLIFGSLVGLGVYARSLVYICGRDEILIIAGRRHTLSDGRTVGYRVVSSGRAVKRPLVEIVHRMDISPFAVPITTDAFLANDNVVALRAIAMVRISMQHVDAAIERFLGKDRDEIERLVRDLLVGHIRGVALGDGIGGFATLRPVGESGKLARVTSPRAAGDPASLGARIASAASPDLAKLGLELDSFEVRREVDAAAFQHLVHLAGDPAVGYRDSGAPCSADDAVAIVALAQLASTDDVRLLALAGHLYTLANTTAPVRPPDGQLDTLAAQLRGKPAAALAYVVVWLVGPSRTILERVRIALALDEARAAELAAELTDKY